jgi:hypothetical protein
MSERIVPLGATCGLRDLLRRDVRNSSIFYEPGVTVTIWFRVLDSDSSMTGHLSTLFGAKHILAFDSVGGFLDAIFLQVRDFFVTVSASAMAAVSSMRLNNAKPPKLEKTANPGSRSRYLAQAPRDRSPLRDCKHPADRQTQKFEPLSLQDRRLKWQRNPDCNCFATSIAAASSYNREAGLRALVWHRNAFEDFRGPVGADGRSELS